jgi:hypothetical protein
MRKLFLYLLITLLLLSSVIAPEPSANIYEIDGNEFRINNDGTLAPGSEEAFASAMNSDFSNRPEFYLNIIRNTPSVYENANVRAFLTSPEKVTSSQIADLSRSNNMPSSIITGWIENADASQSSDLFLKLPNERRMDTDIRSSVRTSLSCIDDTCPELDSNSKNVLAQLICSDGARERDIPESEREEFTVGCSSLVRSGDSVTFNFDNNKPTIIVDNMVIDLSQPGLKGASIGSDGRITGISKTDEPIIIRFGNRDFIFTATADNADIHIRQFRSTRTVEVRGSDFIMKPIGNGDASIEAPSSSGMFNARASFLFRYDGDFNDDGKVTSIVAVHKHGNDVLVSRESRFNVGDGYIVPASSIDAYGGDLWDVWGLSYYVSDEGDYIEGHGKLNNVDVNGGFSNARNKRNGNFRVYVGSNAEEEIHGLVFTGGYGSRLQFDTEETIHDNDGNQVNVKRTHEITPRRNDAVTLGNIPEDDMPSSTTTYDPELSQFTFTNIGDTTIQTATQIIPADGDSDDDDVTSEPSAPVIAEVRVRNLDGYGNNDGIVHVQDQSSLGEEGEYQQRLTVIPDSEDPVNTGSLAFKSSEIPRQLVALNVDEGVYDYRRYSDYRFYDDFSYGVNGHFELGVDYDNDGIPEIIFTLSGNVGGYYNLGDESNPATAATSEQVKAFNAEQREATSRTSNTEQGVSSDTPHGSIVSIIDDRTREQLETLRSEMAELRLQEARLEGNIEVYRIMVDGEFERSRTASIASQEAWNAIEQEKFDSWFTAGGVRYLAYGRGMISDAESLEERSQQAFEAYKNSATLYRDALNQLGIITQDLNELTQTETDLTTPVVVTTPTVVDAPTSTAVTDPVVTPESAPAEAVAPAPAEPVPAPAESVAAPTESVPAPTEPTAVPTEPVAVPTEAVSPVAAPAAADSTATAPAEPVVASAATDSSVPVEATRLTSAQIREYETETRKQVNHVREEMKRASSNPRTFTTTPIILSPNSYDDYKTIAEHSSQQRRNSRSFSDERRFWTANQNWAENMMIYHSLSQNNPQRESFLREANLHYDRSKMLIFNINLP